MDRGAKPIYVLKLDMLLRVLQSHQQTCELWAGVPAGSIAAATSKLSGGKIQTACQAELSVVQGEVCTCLIRDQKTELILLEGQSAFDHLRLCGELCWSVQPRPVSSPQLSLSSAVEEGPDDGQDLWLQRVPPHRVAHIEQGQVDVLPRRHRQVLNLVDGQRRMHEICRMLHCSFEQLTVILDDLEARHLILLPRANGGQSNRK